MRIVIQRVKQASVSILNEETAANDNGNGIKTPKVYTEKAAIGPGFVILTGICNDDTQEDVEWLVKKVVNLRVFDDADGVMNRSILDIGGQCLVVSQFTLYASYKKGKRPSWFRAGSHEHSIPLYEAFCQGLEAEMGKPVGTGVFGADMQVSLTNDGPVTICMDTKNKE